ncbi:MAG TPA: hypothetical protein O0X01_01000, partial [Methanocorpusculum sp.]|nr:hypothetical protein [Methanocorpusculum sp.]
PYIIILSMIMSKRIGTTDFDINLPFANLILEIFKQIKTRSVIFSKKNISETIPSLSRPSLKMQALGSEYMYVSAKIPSCAISGQYVDIKEKFDFTWLTS